LSLDGFLTLHPAVFEMNVEAHPDLSRCVFRLGAS